MPNKKPKSKSTRFQNIVIALLLLILIFGGAIAYRYYRFIKSPNIQVLNKKDGYLYIPSDADFEDVIGILQAEGYLIHENSFRWLSEQKKYIKNIKPGRYILTDNMSNNDLINMLRIGDQEPIRVTFNQVHNFQQLASVVSKHIEADSAQLSNHWLNEKTQQIYGFSKANFIAMFLPNTYEFYWNTSAEEFTQRMASEFKQFWNAERVAKAKTMGMSQSEVSTLASIVQSETRKRDEMPVVAGLYINRLKKGIRLQADPTVKFAVGDPSLKRIYFKHLEIESPYNTYKVLGLPPGPITFPETYAIDAVLNYQKHNYIFMCAKPDYSGYHNFATTLNEHNRYRNLYIKFLKKEGIR
jgi:UPF0755 protein